MQNGSWIRLVLSELRADALAYAVMLGYIGAAVLAAPLFGLRFNPFLYFKVMLVLILPVLFFLWLGKICILAIRHDPRRPFTSLPRVVGHSLSPRAATLLPFFLLLPVTASAFSAFKSTLPRWAEYSWDVPLAQLDRLLHGGQDPWRVLEMIWPGPWLTMALEGTYGLAWFLATTLAPVFAMLWVRDHHLRLQYILTFLISWIVLGNVLAGVFLSAGPCFYGHFTGDTQAFAYIRDYLESLPTRVAGAHTLQDILLHMQLSRDVEIGKGISAFPSMHVATAATTALLLARCGRVAATLGWAYLFIVQVASVHLGWHYAVDGYFSIIAVIALWLLIGRVVRLIPAVPVARPQ